MAMAISEQVLMKVLQVYLQPDIPTQSSIESAGYGLVVLQSAMDPVTFTWPFAAR